MEIRFTLPLVLKTIDFGRTQNSEEILLSEPSYSIKNDFEFFSHHVFSFSPFTYLMSVLLPLAYNIKHLFVIA